MNTNGVIHNRTFKGFILTKDYVIKTNITQPNIDHKFFSLHNGILIIKKGYWWNGVTGWVTTKSTLRSSLVHDCFYQMMQESLLNLRYKTRVDKLYYNMAIEDGGWKWWIKTQCNVLKLVKIKQK